MSFECKVSFQERAKLFFTQKLVNMMGMIFAAISPPVIALMWRRTSYEEYLVDCDYIFHSDSNETHILHGTKVDQLLYIDDNGPGITINKTAEFCESGAGSFCFEVSTRLSMPVSFSDNIELPTPQPCSVFSAYQEEFKHKQSSEPGK